MAISFRIMVFITLAAAVIPPPITTTTTVGSLKDDIKCGDCSCGTTCYTSPPPPLPPSPPPPHKKPSPTPGVKGPPPPSGGGGGGGSGLAPPDYTYVSGPPKDIYPVVQSISAARRSFTVAPEIMMLLGLLGLLAFG